MKELRFGIVVAVAHSFSGCCSSSDLSYHLPNSSSLSAVIEGSRYYSGGRSSMQLNITCVCLQGEFETNSLQHMNPEPVNGFTINRGATITFFVYVSLSARSQFYAPTIKSSTKPSELSSSKIRMT